MAESRHRTTPRRAAGRLLGLLLTTSLFAAGTTAAHAADPLRQVAARQGIHFGSAIADQHLSIPQYRQIAGEQFSAVTAENEMKWESLEGRRGQYNWGPADSIIDFAEQNDQIVRGHTLVWHSQLPSWLNDGGFSGSQLQGIMDDHIEAVAGRYAGDVYAWDVVNEPFNEDGTFRDSIWYRGLGQDYIADALRKAHEVDPNAELYINDYNVAGINSKSDGLYDLAVRLLDEGVPLHGIGIQSHLVSGQVPSSMRQNIQRFADLGLDVAITELDIRMQTPSDSSKLQQQADDYTTVVNACLAVSRCVGVTVWGVDDGHSWVPGVFDGQGAALLYDAQYQPKPAWNAVHAALGGTDGPEDPDGPDEPSGPCAVEYTVVNDWGSGFQGSVEITNTGSSAVTDWQLAWDFPGVTVTNGWNGQWSQSGGRTTVSAPSWNPTLQAGRSTTLGFVADKSGSVSPPGEFRLNGTVCS